MRDVDALVFDLQDIGTRTWTYVGAMIYSMRTAKRTGKMIMFSIVRTRLRASM